MASRIIGISGVAGSGKDLFYSLLKEHINCERFSLADEIKSEMRDFIFKNYSIDILNCSWHEKNSVRSYLVAHGMSKRGRTKGRFWIDKLEPQVKERIFNHYCVENKSENLYPVITDIRFDKYDQDEVFWLKEQMGGILVHISLFEMQNGQRVFKQPANEDEASQNPSLIEKADYLIEWEKVKGGIGETKKILQPVMKDFVKFLK